MSSQTSPIVLPQRLSLATQAAAALRRGIEQGNWKEFLPSERHLCEMLQVSRPTIRTALHSLAKEGLLDIRQGRRNRLLRRSRKAREARNRLVAIVTSEPVTVMGNTAFHGVSELRTHLAAHGFASEILVCQSPGRAAQQHKIEAYVRHNRVFCCVLVSPSRELQQWFAAHSIPALVLGSCHGAVKLPSLDVDYQSVCRHAGGVFLAKGHRRMALVVPDSGVAGDVASEQGFMEAVSCRPRADGIRAVILRHDGSAQQICAKLDGLLKSAQPPTALLVAKPQHVFIVVIYLLKRGLAVPDAISLIARDQDPLFANVSPPIAHYRFGDDAYSHRLTRLMLQLVSESRLPIEPHLIFPRFFAGGTVKTLV